MISQTGSYRKATPALSKFYDSKEFKSLSQHWENILMMTGFEDAERLKRGERVLKKLTEDICRQKSQEEIDTKTRYFIILNNHYERARFTSDFDRTVMKFYKNGLSIKQITIQLLLLGQPTHRQTIRYIIRRYEHRWGIRFWTLKQRYLKYEPSDV